MLALIYIYSDVMVIRKDGELIERDVPTDKELIEIIRNLSRVENYVVSVHYMY